MNASLPRLSRLFLALLASAGLVMPGEGYSQDQSPGNALPEKPQTVPARLRELDFTPFTAALAGLDVAGSFGPQPLSPADVAALVDLHPTVILENKHMPGGAGLADASGAVQLDMTNFPGDDLDLKAVVTINADVLIEGIK